MKLPQDKTKEELLNDLEKINEAFRILSRNYETLSAEAKQLRKEIAEVNSSAINFENKVERLLGKEALGIVMYGSKEAYERMMAIEDHLKNAKTQEEKDAAFAELLAFESDDPYDKTLMDDELDEVEQEQ